MELYKLIYERSYEEAEEYLQSELKKRKLERMEFYLLNLIHSYLKVRNGKDLTVVYEYKVDMTNDYKVVFEALKNRDYLYAKERLDNILRTSSPKLEFQLYSYIVDDIVEILNTRVVDPVNNMKLRLNEFLNDHKLMNYEELLILEDLNNQLYDLCIENGRDVYYTVKIAEIIVVYKQVLEGTLDENYFETLESESDLESDLINKLNNGDYLSANELININSIRIEYPNLDYYYILYIKKLLVSLIRKMEEKQIHTPLFDSVVTYLYFNECNKDIEEVKKILKHKQLSA